MLFSSIGYYSLIFGLIVSFPIFFFSIKNFRNKELLDYKIITFTFIQLFLVVISFLGLIFSFIYSDFSNETVFNNSHTTKTNLSLTFLPYMV
ncbi:hypothetical protein N9341_04995 [Candidatus Pelagibacter sp.]|nr:hypothetical protein [Candidatus Pelagibacter sp.]